eukprot:COSAG01_NODE_9344_length_2477_cov_0.850715_1_plen_153_part_00
MPFMDWPESWSPEYPSGELAPYFFPTDNVHVLTCAAQGPVALPAGSPPSGLNGTEKFSWCALEVDKDDNKTFGQQVRDNCVQRIELAASHSATSGKPFFIGCGFHKPHAPYYAPREFFDRLPDWQSIPLPVDQFAPVGMPVVAWHPYAGMMP